MSVFRGRIDEALRQRDDGEPSAHPTDHEPHWLFLRQVRHPADEEHEAVIDVFYCARCLARQEVLDRVDSSLSPDEQVRRRRGAMPALGSAVPRD